MKFALICSEEGRHGFSVVGFDSKVEAEGWRDERGLRGIVKPLIEPGDWKLNDGSHDDEAGS